MRNSISHTKNDFEGIRSHNPSKLLCLSPKICCTREITSLTGSSSHEELNRPGTFWRKTCNPYRGMTPFTLCLLDTVQLWYSNIMLCGDPSLY